MFLQGPLQISEDSVDIGGERKSLSVKDHPGRTSEKGLHRRTEVESAEQEVHQLQVPTEFHTGCSKMDQGTC